jgi:bifunctional UDP-N-acetylglucosamine pyrophosphorylase/glucosamine-1-phosphate N-acetyltransferase
MSKNQLSIVILAAGQGTRMKSVKPKVMHELAGLPMIKWLIGTAEKLSPQKIIVVAGPNMPELQQAAKPHASVIQQTRDGTAGALRMALPELKNFKGDVLVLVGDAPLMSRETLENLVALRRSKKAGMTVLGAEVCCADGLGRIVADKSGTLKKIIEHKDASETEREIKLINTGAFCIDGARLEKWLGKVKNNNAAKEYYITDLPAIAAKDKVVTKVYVTKNTDEVRGCNSRSDLAALEKTAQERLRNAVMNNGVTMIDPCSVTLHHDTVIGADSVIEPNVFFGPGVRIASRRGHSRLLAYRGVGYRCGRDHRPVCPPAPRRGYRCGSRVGNFVEVKKSKIGAGSKINHLAYVGDTDMGADVNFSAGAITVNYDGFDKHKTIIGKGAMVGSNVNLVAPVTVGEGAFIAAGSTITDDVASDALAIERGNVEIREGWASENRAKKSGKKK